MLCCCDAGVKATSHLRRQTVGGRPHSLRLLALLIFCCCFGRTSPMNAYSGMKTHEVHVQDCGLVLGMIQDVLVSVCMRQF